MLPEGLPKKTLGWGVLDWGSRMLAQPDGDHVGEKWTYTNEQARFILWFYAVDDKGKWLYRNGMLSRPKGWGKSPLLAALCCTELLGPVIFSHFDSNGNAVGKRRPMATVQLVATAFEQTENTMSLVLQMLGQGPAAAHYGLDMGLTRVRAPGGATLTRITAASSSKEGQRPTFAVLDETHLWVDSNGGPELFEVVDRNLGKSKGRWVQTTNAPVPGEESVAELTDRMWDAIQAGNAEPDLLYDNRGVVIEDIHDKETAWPLLEYLYGDSLESNGGWVDLDDIWAKVISPMTRDHVARRFYFNQRVRMGSGWLNSAKWNEQGRDDLKLKKSERIALGFRGQTRNGATSLVACRLRDGAIFVLKVWETDENLSEINYVEVDDYVRDVLDNYEVTLMFAAPQNWQDIVGRWYEANEDVVEEFWTSQKLKMEKAIEQFETAVYMGRLVHPNNSALTRHIDNCYPVEDSNGKTVGLRKVTKHSPNYISAAEAAVLAFEAAQEAIQRGLDNDGPSNTVWSF